MTSEKTVRKAEAHDVEAYSYTRAGVHAFAVVSSESGRRYHPRVKALCDCPYMSVQGSANGRVCSHIIKAFSKIVEQDQREE